MHLKIELDTDAVKLLILNAIQERAGSIPFDKTKVKIKVMSRQNYRVKEWEDGDIQATFEADV